MGVGITLNTVSRDEHVPEAERNVRTVKDQVQSFLTTLPFRKFPDRIVIEIVLGQVFWFAQKTQDNMDTYMHAYKCINHIYIYV